MTDLKFSGRVTAQHPIGLEKDADEAPDCIQQVILFDVQWTNCPVEVEDQVRNLWRHNEFGNDNYYYRWTPADAKQWPVIGEYLKSRGVGNCLIYWWW